MDPEALDFAEFYRSSWGPCLKAVLASQSDDQKAEEQVAEAFARALAAWSRVRHHPAPRAWVVRTALNLGVSWWRRHRREVPLTGAGPVGPVVPELAVDDRLLDAIRRLPGREREVVVLRLVLDMDTATTASQLGIAPGTVRAHLSRAVAALRLALPQYREEMEAAHAR